MSFGASRLLVAKTVALIAICWMLLMAKSTAIDVTLGWDASPDSDISGYSVRYGTASGQYDHTVDAGSATSTTLTGLSAGTYYCTVVAKNSVGLQSPPSEELSFNVSANVPPLMGLSNGQSLNWTGPVSLKATSFGSDISRLEFYVGGTKVGEVNSATEAASWQPPQAGDYAVTVNGYNASGFVATSTLNLHIIRPAVTDLKRTPDSAFEMTVTGAPGRRQRVEVSDDLKTWTPFADAVNSTGAMVVRDEGMAQKTKRFYRVVSE